MKKVLLSLLLLLVPAASALANAGITLPPTTPPFNFTQDDFKGLSRELGLAISYVPLAPAEPLGGTVLPGFDIGVEATGVLLNTDNPYWQKINAFNKSTGSDTIPSTLPEAKVHVQVGLPVIPIDVGFVYGEAQNTDIKFAGGEVKWAILRGSVATPALALRGAYTKLSGVSDLDLSTASADISISKGFAVFTPYAGYGMVWIDSKPKSSLNPTLQEENLYESKGFLGCKITFFPLLNMVAEADFARVNSYSLRLNLHF